MKIKSKTQPSLSQNLKEKTIVQPSLLVGFTSCKDITGLALAFDLLLAGFKERGIAYRLVDYGTLGLASQPGVFNIGRIFSTLTLLFDFCKKLPGTQSVYIVIASSKFGFIRDAFMIWVSRLFGKHTVLHLHGGGYKDFYEKESNWGQWFIKKTISQSDKIVVLGELLKDQFAFVTNKEQKICIVPNGLPLNLHPTTTQAKKILLDEPIQLLYLSNLIQSKGYLVLLEACKILHQEKGLFIHCNFCGQFTSTANDEKKSPAQLKQQFFDLITKWGLDKVVTYHGIVGGQQKEQLLIQAHALVLPTTYPWEGQPICIIEAMAYGTPIVATPHRGIPEEVIDGYNGFLADATPHQIANAIEKLCKNPSLYEQYSKHALIHYKKHFTPETYNNRLISVILGMSKK